MSALVLGEGWGWCFKHNWVPVDEKKDCLLCVKLKEANK